MASYNKFCNFYNSLTPAGKTGYLNYYDYNNKFKNVNIRKTKGLKPISILSKKFFKINFYNSNRQHIGYIRYKNNVKNFKFSLPIYGPVNAPIRETIGEYHQLKFYLGKYNTIEKIVMLQNSGKWSYLESFIKDKLNLKLEKLVKKQKKTFAYNNLKYKNRKQIKMINLFNLLECEEAGKEPVEVSPLRSSYRYKRNKKLNKFDNLICRLDRDYIPKLEIIRIRNPILLEKLKLVLYNFRELRKCKNFVNKYRIRLNCIYIRQLNVEQMFSVMEPSEKFEEIDYDLYFAKLEHETKFKYVLQEISTYTPMAIRTMWDDFMEELSDCDLEPEMDTDEGAHGNLATTSETTGNVTIESNSGSSEAVTAAPSTSATFQNMSASEVIEGDKDLMNRFFTYKSFKWSATDERGKELVDIALPIDFVKNCPNSANCTLFSNYAYWQGDMLIKILVNANKFQIGQLQSAWYYGSDYDKFYKNRKTIFDASQMPHCLINAGTSNEGHILIPYRYYKPQMGTKARKDDPGRLNMGRLSIKVLNPLDCPSTSYKTVTVTIMIAFVNSSFSGMLARDLGTLQGEMGIVNNFLSSFVPGYSAVRAAMNAIDQVDADLQRDNPPDVRPATTIMPVNAHSWCTGDVDVEPTNPLRLNPTGQTPHPREIMPSYDEMTVDHVKRIFGLVKIIKWSFDQAEGTLLFEMDVSPSMMWEKYCKAFSGKNMDYYNVPPLTFLSFLYALWRGGIELRLDLICSMYHTGRLQMGYVTRVLDTPTFEQIKSCPSLIMDLEGGSAQFSFTIPYNADRPWWHTRGNKNDILPPAKVYCYVLNPLVPMDNICNYVEINVYMRAASDFEFAIPISPQICIPTNNPDHQDKHIHDKVEIVLPFSARLNFYVDGRESVENQDLFISWEDHDAPLEFNRLYNNIYKLIYVNNGNVTYPTAFESTTTTKESDWCIVPYYPPTMAKAEKKSSSLGLYARNTADAKAYLKTLELKDLPKYMSNKANIHCLQDCTSILERKDIYGFKYGFKAAEKFEWQPEGDERMEAVASTEQVLGSVASTNYGHKTFGENHGHLKALCRRYQLYSSFAGKTGKMNRILDCIPLMPQMMLRTDEMLDTFPIMNSMRDGMIPLIASGYRYYRGGLRLRIVWKSNYDGMLRVEHHPDVKYQDKCLSAVLPYFNDSYAVINHNTKINNIVEFEVPFYNTGLFNFLQRPVECNDLEAFHYSLGELRIGFTPFSTLAQISVTYDVYYALADDCRFYLFQGFPPIAPLPAIKEISEFYGLCKEVQTNLTIKPKTDLKHTTVSSKSLVPSMDCDDLELEPEMDCDEWEPEGLYDYLPFVGKFNETLDGGKQTFDKTAEEFAKTAKKTNGLIDTVNAQVAQVSDEAVASMKIFQDLLPGDLAQAGLSALLHLIHVLIAPSIQSIAVAFAGVLTSVGILTMKFVDQFISSFSRVMNIFGTSKRNTPGTPEADNIEECELNGEMDVGGMEKDEFAAFASTIVMSTLALLGTPKKSITLNPCKLAGNIFHGLGPFCRNSMYITQFLKHNLEWIMRIVKYVGRAVYPDNRLAMEIQDQELDIQAFGLEVDTLLNEVNRRRIERDPLWTMRVYECAAQAQIIKLRLIATRKLPNTPVLLKSITDIINLRNELTRQNLSPPVRFEPFVMYFSGDANLGKSRMINNLLVELLKSIDYKSYEEIRYVRTPGNQYWNGLKNQPVLIYDDFGALDGELGAMQAAEMFCVKSKAIFNPNCAAIPDKNIRYNPLMVMCASNQAYPKMTSVKCEQALWRRRDILIAVLKNEDFYNKHGIHLTEGSPNEFVDKGIDISKYQHLLFKILPSRTETATNAKNCPTYTYEELVKELQSRFVKFYTKQMKEYMDSLKEAYQFIPKDNDTTVCEDLVELYERISSLNKYRFDCLPDIEELLLSEAPKIQDLNSRLLPGLLANLLTLKELDICKYKAYCEKFPIFEQYMETLKQEEKVKLNLEGEMKIPDGGEPEDETKLMLYAPVQATSEDDFRHLRLLSLLPLEEYDDISYFTERLQVYYKNCLTSMADRQKIFANAITSLAKDLKYNQIGPYFCPKMIEIKFPMKNEKGEYMYHPDGKLIMASHRAPMPVAFKEHYVEEAVIVSEEVVEVMKEHKLLDIKKGDARFEEIFGPNKEPREIDIDKAWDSVFAPTYVKKMTYQTPAGRFEMTKEAGEDPKIVEIDAEKLKEELKRTDAINRQRERQEQLRAKKEKAEKEGQTYEPHGEELFAFCPHVNFSPIMDYHLEATIGDKTYNNFFATNTDIICHRVKNFIPEAYCVGECYWEVRDKDGISNCAKAMEAWAQYDCIVRQNYIQNGYYHLVPRYFRTSDMNKVLDQVQGWQTWYNWSCEVIKMYCSKIWKIIKSLGKVILAITMIGTVIYMGAKYFQKSEPDDALLEDDATEGEGYPGKMKAAGKGPGHSKRNIGIKFIKGKGLKGEMGSERQYTVTKLIRRNCLFIKMATASGRTYTGRLMGLVEHQALGAIHYHDQFLGLANLEGSHCTIEGEGFVVEINYKDLEVEPFEDSGLCIYHMPVQIPLFKNIIKHIASAKEQDKVGESAHLVELDKDMQHLIPWPLPIRVLAKRVVVPKKDFMEPFVIPDGYVYPMNRSGLCGSVLVSDNLAAPIIGFHVAGDTKNKKGISELITREQFLGIMKEAVVKDVIEPEMGEYVSGLKPETNVQVLGVVPNELVHRETGTSKIIPTECHGEIVPVRYGTPVLSPRDERISDDPYSPMQEGINKHGILTKNFPMEYVKTAADDLLNEMISKVRPVRLEVGRLPLQVAICGDPDIAGFDKLDFNTSEGFPYSSCRPKGVHSKVWLFDLDQDEKGHYLLKGLDPMLEEIMCHKEMQRSEGYLPFTPFIDCLKDEKLPLEKCTTPGKVRVFSISPLDYTIHTRQFFMDFTVSWQNARLNLDHAVGISTDSREWSELAYQLMEKGDNIFTADYSNFGPSLNLAVAYAAFEIILDWYVHYGDKDAYNWQQRWFILLEAIHSVHLSFSVMYRTLCGLPSGGPLTVVQNSLVNKIYIRIAWIIVFTNNVNFVTPTMVDFKLNVRFFVYGDDVIGSVSDAVKDIFNSKSIALTLSKFNIVIKNASKAEEIVPYLPLQHPDTSFLKCGFQFFGPPGSYKCLAPLKKEAVEETINWTYKEWQYKLREISLEACDQACRNCFGHGPEAHRDLVIKCRKYWQAKGVTFDTPNWFELHYLYFGRDV